MTKKREEEREREQEALAPEAMGNKTRADRGVNLVTNHNHYISRLSEDHH